MGLPLTLDLAREHLGTTVLHRNRSGGRRWLPAKLVGLANERDVYIRPGHHKRNERVPLTDCKLNSKVYGAPMAKNVPAMPAEARWHVERIDDGALLRQIATNAYDWIQIHTADDLGMARWYQTPGHARSAIGRLKGHPPGTFTAVSGATLLAKLDRQPIPFRPLTADDATKAINRALSKPRPDPVKAPPVTVAPPAPALDPVAATFEAWAAKVRETALAETLKLEVQMEGVRLNAELAIACRRRELGL